MGHTGAMAKKPLYDLFLDGAPSGEALTYSEVGAALPKESEDIVVRVYLTGTKVDKTDRFLI